MKLVEGKSIAKKMEGYKFMNSRPQIHGNCEGTTMSYKIDFGRSPEYFSLSVRGTINTSDARTCWDKLQELFHVCDRTRVLIDTTNVIARILAVEDYTFINELVHEFPSNLSMALIVSPVSVPFWRFIESAAVNNGVRLRTFTEKNEAVAWLMKQPSGIPDRRMCRAS